jgi:hypothetical protein
MKNLFIINEEEKKRILNLHESASKRHYLSEQEYKSTIGGVTMVVDKDGKQKRAFNLDTDENLVDWSSRFSGQGSKPIQPKVTKPDQKKATDPIPVKQTPCPVGDKKAVMAFQDWLDTNVKGWLPKYPDGLNQDPKKGYGMCGPNTRKAWKSNETAYKVKFVPGEIAHDPKDDDVVVPTNSPESPKTQETPAAETPKQTLTQQKKAPNADIDNDI